MARRYQLVLIYKVSGFKFLRYFFPVLSGSSAELCCKQVFPSVLFPPVCVPPFHVLEGTKLTATGNKSENK